MDATRIYSTLSWPAMPGPVQVYKPLAFYSDGASKRTLKTAATSDTGGMTIEECTSFCTPLGFQFAGVEFGRVSVLH